MKRITFAALQSPTVPPYINVRILENDNMVEHFAIALWQRFIFSFSLATIYHRAIADSSL
jgi:hypothetical protein